MIRYALIAVFVATFALPLFTAWTLWRANGESGADVVLRVAVSLLGLLLFFVVCNWALVAVWVPPLLGVACAALVARPLRRARELPLFQALTVRRAVGYSIWAASLGLMGLVLYAIVGVPYPQRVVDLHFPLSDAWYVSHGGNSLLLNPHQMVAAQSYALDILGLNAWGTRARGVLPQELGRYSIFDAPVHSPCDGEVLSAEDGFEDQTPPTTDAQNLAGNHVTIHCGDDTILLAHLRRGSVLPRLGDILSAGQLIAHAGNSGNTSEPHLHIHAVRGRVTDRGELLKSGTPVPMRFHGRFLHRHSSSFWGTRW